MSTWSESPSKALWTAFTISPMPSMPLTASLVNRPSSSTHCCGRSPPIWSRCAPNAANLALENVAQKTINYLPNLAKKCIPHHTETGRKINPKCALTSCHSGRTIVYHKQKLDSRHPPRKYELLLFFYNVLHPDRTVLAQAESPQASSCSTTR